MRNQCVYHTIRLLRFRTLNWALDDVKLQDFLHPILGVSSSGPEGGAIAWDFFKSNFAKVPVDACLSRKKRTFKWCDSIAGAVLVQIKAKVGDGSPELMTMAVVYSCYGLVSTQDIDEIEAFFRSNPLPDNQHAISQMLEVCVFKIWSDVHDSHLLDGFIFLLFRQNDRWASLWKKSSLP